MTQYIFSLVEKKQIEDAISKAETCTSGEIRVHIDAACKGNVLDRAAYVFEKLEMHKTEQRNGVLFYIAYSDKKFAVLGDAGINQKVPANFWDEIKDTMVAHFKQSEFVEGISKGVEMAGLQLATHFPYQLNDTNELHNEITFDV